MFLERAVAASGSGIVVADATQPGFPLSYVNAAFERLTGYSSAECLGRNCRFLQGHGTDPAAVAEIGVALWEGREARVVLLNNRKDGTPFHNELRLSPIRDASGRVVEVVGVQADVSDQVAARRKLEDERDRAVTELAAIQEALTPPAIGQRPGLDLATACVPAEHGVSGDFHLVAAGPTGTTIMVLGDAMGHGLQAARRATFVRTTLATFAPFTDDPRRLLEMAHHALVEKAGTSDQFITAVCATYDPVARQLSWASAGHAVPLDLDSGLPLGSDAHVGTALGIARNIDVKTTTIRLGNGRGVLLASDGLHEARARATSHGPAARLGGTRVAELLQQQHHGAPAAVVATLSEAAIVHADGDLTDDLCLLAARTSTPHRAAGRPRRARQPDVGVPAR